MAGNNRQRNRNSAKISPLPIASIRCDGEVQCRVKIEPMIVDGYAEAMRSKEHFPAVIVFYDGEHYWLADGFHRIKAAEAADRKKIDAEVRPGSRRDAILFAVGANSKHGMPRTNKDKRRAVLMLLNDAEWGRWSDREIARRCAIDHDMVGRLRKEASGGSRQIGTRQVQRKGTTYSMRTVRIGHAGRIVPDVRAKIRSLPIVDNPADLRLLAKLAPDGQRAALGKLLAGDAKSVRQAQQLLDADAIDRELPEFPNGPFRLIVVDPPWPYTCRLNDATKQNVVRYATMSLEEIQALPVGQLAHDDSVLFLWTTNAFYRAAHDIAVAWGFEPVTMLTWFKPRAGTGDWLRGQTEHAILAKKGWPKKPLKTPSTALQAPTRGHSVKPSEFFEMVAKRYPGPRVELFARARRDGWVTHGHGLTAATPR